MKPANKMKRTAGRIADWAALIDSKNPECGKKQLRKETGGFHKPGSNNK